jgi:hypothetical protein
MSGAPTAARTARHALLAAALLLLGASPALAAAPGRFAVVAGNDIGGAGRPKLWFAEKDAVRFRDTLVELGDFDPDQVVLLRGASPAALRTALASLEPRIQAARARGERTLLVVYYSGHAGSRGLELGLETLAFDELRQRVVASSADAKIGIVDACESGLLTQVKGAAAAPLLDFALPADDAVQGTAFLASTAVGEVAQESAALGGSFFTHHLEAGLRGAADADGDGVVTLQEAFRYTSGQTVVTTAGTREGPQHPTYELRMSGRGDVALADLRRAEAKLRIPPATGSSFLLRGPRGLLVEVAGATTEVTLALPAGHYTVERRSELGRARGTVELDRGASLTLPELTPTRYELARSKGGPKPGLVYLGGGVAATGLAGFGVAPMARLAVREEAGPVGLRLRLDVSRKHVVDQQLSYDWSGFGAGLAAFLPLTTSWFLIEAGPEVAYTWATQRLSSGKSFEAGVLGVGLAALATAPLGPLRVGLDLTTSAHVFRLDQKRSVRPAASAGLMVLYDF